MHLPPVYDGILFWETRRKYTDLWQQHLCQWIRISWHRGVCGRARLCEIRAEEQILRGGHDRADEAGRAQYPHQSACPVQWGEWAGGELSARAADVICSALRQAGGVWSDAGGECAECIIFDTDFLENLLKFIWKNF